MKKLNSYTPLIEKITAELNEDEYQKYWIMDAGYDYREIYQNLYCYAVNGISLVKF